MLTYALKKAPGVPLYEALYRCIRGDILSGALSPGEKLPSKRALATHLEISKITVEAAYGQLLAEGYISSREKVGYFVEAVEAVGPAPVPLLPPSAVPCAAPCLDLTANTCGEFPFSVWSRLQREVISDVGPALLAPLPNRGLPGLRSAIAAHLAAFRGMHVDPEQILIGAGTDFLYNLIIQLLGRDRIYAVEEPGYDKIRKIYAAGGVACISAPMDSQGVIPEQLANAQILHISPSHHFPSGLVTPMPRRSALLEWVAGDPSRYLIEDDYDSEFRFDAHPMPTMASMDRTGQVLYMNTFSKTLSSAIRISYLVLPPALMRRFQSTLGFYSCTVPSFEQYTLARFIHRGYFEKHINRMRKTYKSRRNLLLTVLRTCPMASRLEILEEDAGLHFLVRVDTGLSAEALVQLCREAGICIRSLDSYYCHPIPREKPCLVVNYSGLSPEDITLLAEKLSALP